MSGGPDENDAEQDRLVAFNLRGREGGAMPESTDKASVRASQGGSSRTYVAFGGNRTSGPLDVAAAVNAGGGQRTHGL